MIRRAKILSFANLSCRYMEFAKYIGDSIASMKNEGTRTVSLYLLRF